MIDTTTLLARRNRALGAGAPLFYEHPLHIVRGEGVYLYDADGRCYVDMYNNVPASVTRTRVWSRRWRASRRRSTFTVATCTKLSSTSANASLGCTNGRSRASS